MKSLKILLLGIFCVNCVTPSFPTESDGGYVYKGYDFREYAEKGILVTTTEPTGNYQSKGIIQVTLNPEVKEVSVSNYNAAKRNNGIIELNNTIYEMMMVPFFDGTRRYYRIEVTTTEDAIDEIVNTAIEWGADAIYDFNVINETVNDNGLSKVIRTISGFAVKRQAEQIEIVDG
jgi:uncharacterized protein YbjQ (UPF0145 family)